MAARAVGAGADRLDELPRLPSPRKGESLQTTKSIIAAGGQPTRFTETPADVVRRVCGRDFGSKRSILVLNDEAHHCYRSKPAHEEDTPPQGLDADTREEIKENKKATHAWLSGLQFVQQRIGIKIV